MIPDRSINAWCIFGCRWKWKLRVIENTLWYTWYIFGRLWKNEGHVICVVYFWVSLIKRSTRYDDSYCSSWYLFLGFSEKKEKTWDNTCYMLGFFLKKEEKACNTTCYFWGTSEKKMWYNTWCISGNIWRERPEILL